jgi:gliding motility-associated-like protein
LCCLTAAQDFYKISNYLALKKLICYLLLAFPYMVFSQNLVKNPSFESFNDCPLIIDFNNQVVDWQSLGSSHYFNACAPTYGYGVPINQWGYQDAHSGVAYAAVKVYYYDVSGDFRGYIEGSFTELLQKDSLYCVSYYVNLIDIADGAIKNVDAYISDTLVDYPSDTSSPFTIELPAQIRSQQLLTDSINWSRVSGLYKAHGGEKYIVIGNFNSRENTTKVQYNPAGINLSYFIDDVSVVKAGIDLQAPDLGTDTVICRSALPIHLTAPTGYDAYQWSNGATTRETDATDHGKYWVKCIINGCGELYDEKIISFDTPLLHLGKDTVICKGEKIVISAQPGFSIYRWSNGDTTQSITVASAGNYSLTTTDRCGSQSDTITVVIDTIPAGLIELGNDTTMCWFGTDLPVIIASNTQLPNYYWNTGDTSAAITVTERGMYTLRSRFRCGDVTDSIFVNQCPPAIFFPNAFTPDNDGLNDVFRAITINTQVELMIIYNRWGQKIYESNDLFPEWDGTANKEASPNGLYAYVVYYSDAESGFAKKEKRGTVMLIR